MRKNLGWFLMTITFVLGVVYANSTAFKAERALSEARDRVAKAIESPHPRVYSTIGLMEACRNTNEPLDCSYDRNGNVVVSYLKFDDHGMSKPYRTRTYKVH